MDETKTAPFELGSGEPCLLLHGFTGSPWDMRPLGEALAADYHVRCIRLPGHGTTPQAMASVTHVDWFNASRDALLGFRDTTPIFVVGFSVGGLLALRLAAEFPKRVRALALLAPAMQFIGWNMALVNRLRRIPGIERLRPYILKTSTDLSDAEVVKDAPLLPAFPSARLRDVFLTQDAARAILPRVVSPALTVMAVEDHVVALSGGTEIVRGLTHAPMVRQVHLREGFHILPRDRAGGRVTQEIRSFFDAVRQREAAL